MASNVFEELSVLEGWLQMVADVQYRKIREAANEEWKGASRATVTRRHRVLHAVIFESWAAGLYQEDPAGFVVAATTLDGLAYRSLLECSSVDGIDSLPSDLPPKFRSVAKKWFRCNEQREKDSDARRDDQRAARSKDQPLTVLDVAEQIAIHGLMHLPRELTPSHTELNAFQRKVEREPDVALPYVDIHKEPYTPVTAGWITASHRPFVQTVCALQRYLVIAGLTGAFGRNPLPVVFGYPALVCDLAARFGCSLAREYDEQARRRFASERRAVPGTIILTAASERLLCLDTATVLSLNMNAGTLGCQSLVRPGHFMSVSQGSRRAQLAVDGTALSLTTSLRQRGLSQDEIQDVLRRHKFAEEAFDSMPAIKEMPQLDEEMAAAISYAATTPVAEAQRMRLRFLAHWRRRAAELPIYDGKPCHVELLCEMLCDLGIVGVDDLLHHLRTGCPMSGSVGYEGLYAPAPRVAPEISVEELIRRQPEVLARSVRAIRSTGSTDKVAIWRSVRKELAAGFMVEVCPPANAVYLRRFVIRQTKFDEEGSRVKERACDDGRMALVNKAVQMSTPVKLDTADVFVEVARQVAVGALECNPDATFQSIGLDHKDAYRQLRARNDIVCSRLGHAWAELPIRGLLPERRRVEQRVVDEAIAEVLGGASASSEP
ncbi:hypothetical protein DIPPA_28003 [Diplonema papillatum]|nr:hypothetical protein DIPPA_28003 [Diplonema papillatum]